MTQNRDTTMRKRKKVDPADFWDMLDTTNYLEPFRAVKVGGELIERRYEIEIDSDVMRMMRAQARLKRVSISNLASDLLRQPLSRR